MGFFEKNSPRITRGTVLFRYVNIIILKILCWQPAFFNEIWEYGFDQQIQQISRSSAQRIAYNVVYTAAASNKRLNELNHKGENKSCENSFGKIRLFDYWQRKPQGNK